MQSTTQTLGSRPEAGCQGEWRSWATRHTGSLRTWASVQGLLSPNGLALADMLQRFDTVEEALLAWEAAFRPVAMATQCWSCWYGNLAFRWPTKLGQYRMPALEGINAFRPLGDRYSWLWQGSLPEYRPTRLPGKAVRARRRGKA